MNGETLLFFNGHEGALPLYLHLEQRLRENINGLRTEVKKTQISLFAGKMFGCISFLPVRKKADRPQDYITLTLSSPAPLHSHRVDGCVEVSSGRFTHHILISSVEELNDELMQWVRKAAVFAQTKE